MTTAIFCELLILISFSVLVGMGRMYSAYRRLDDGIDQDLDRLVRESW